MYHYRLVIIHQQFSGWHRQRSVNVLYRMLGCTNAVLHHVCAVLPHRLCVQCSLIGYVCSAPSQVMCEVLYHMPCVQCSLICCVWSAPSYVVCAVLHHMLCVQCSIICCVCSATCCYCCTIGISTADRCHYTRHLAAHSSPWHEIRYNRACALTANTYINNSIRSCVLLVWVVKTYVELCTTLNLISALPPFSDWQQTIYYNLYGSNY